MKINEIRNMTTTELNAALLDFKAELFNLRFQLAANQLDTPAEIRNVKKSIARVRTIIKERELKGETE